MGLAIEIAAVRGTKSASADLGKVKGIALRDTLTKLYVHLVWATWDRLPLIVENVEAAVYACIRQECELMEVDLLAIGGVSDHIHLLVEMPPKLAVSEMMKQIKGSSSHLIAQQVGLGDFFKWQGAYAAFSVSRGDVQKIKGYILRQKEHHRDQTLINEFEPE